MFDVPGPVDPVRVIIACDSDGTVLRFEMGDYDPEFELAFRAMGGEGKLSNAAIMYGMLANGSRVVSARQGGTSEDGEPLWRIRLAEI